MTRRITIVIEERDGYKGPTEESLLEYLNTVGRIISVTKELDEEDKNDAIHKKVFGHG